MSNSAAVIAGAELDAEIGPMMLDFAVESLRALVASEDVHMPVRERVYHAERLAELLSIRARARR